jgi:hypothetical protein
MNVVTTLEDDKSKLEKDVKSNLEQKLQLTTRINDSEIKLDYMKVELKNLNKKQKKAIEDMKLHFEKSLKSALDE